MTRKISSQMPKDYAQQPLQVMTPPAVSPIVTISAAGDVGVSKYSVIRFSDDLDIYWGTDSGNVWPYTAGDYIGIAFGVTTIHISGATQMMVM